ncbi:MAG: TIGR02099 family protein, partial [Pseudomonadota bacterium]|nr:TIGR02099 family protein [Pseudomonadota bacterium]
MAVLLVVGWLSLHWLILPHIDRWREPIEQQASARAGAKVRIGAIHVQSGRWVPTIELRDVRILDAEDRVALALPRVVAAVSMRSLLALDVRFEQLLIDGASLDIRRDASGRIRVAGLDFGSSAAGADDGAAADWFFAQHEFVIRGGSLRWIDEARSALPLQLDQVELVVRNGFKSHALRIDGTPPPEWGERFSVRGEFSQPLFARRGDWRRWSGTVYASLPRADVRELRRHMSLPFDLSEGDGALRAWIELHAGRPVAATVDLALRAVTLRLGKNVEALDVEQVRGRVSGERRGDQVAVQGRGLAFVTGDGLNWLSSDLDVAWQQGESGEVSAGKVVASRLDVGAMAELAKSIPLGHALRELLAELRPQGVVTGLAVTWQGPIDAPERYSLKGTLKGLALASRPAPRADVVGRPGFDHAEVELDANESGGRARLAIAGGRLELPGVFVDPLLPLAELDAKLHWSVDRRPQVPAITVELSSARFANADLHGDLTGRWHTGSGAGRFPGLLALDGHLFDADAARLPRYLPLGLPEGVRSYLTRSVRSGKMASAELRMRGDLAEFPFRAGKRSTESEFRFATKVHDLVFAYVPDQATPSPWPPLTAAAGEVIIDRGSLEIRDARADLGGIAWSGLHGRVAELGPAGRLEVEGHARGALADMVRFVNVTPVGGWTGQALAATVASGAADLHLALTIPLTEPARSSARGTLILGGNDLHLSADTPLLAGARGKVDFSHKGFVVSGGSARMLGGELAFEGGSSAGLAGGEGQRFTGQGVLTAEALRHSSELGTVARLGNALSGQAAYRGSLQFVEGRPYLQFASSLVGMAIELPAPMGKASAVA